MGIAKGRAGSVAKGRAGRVAKGRAGRVAKGRAGSVTERRAGRVAKGRAGSGSGSLLCDGPPGGGFYSRWRIERGERKRIASRGNDDSRICRKEK